MINLWTASVEASGKTLKNSFPVFSVQNGFWLKPSKNEISYMDTIPVPNRSRANSLPG